MRERQDIDNHRVYSILDREIVPVFSKEEP
jgi:hypothetical protein